MQHPKLQAEKRDVLGKKVKHLRSEGLLPANVYGKGIDSISLVLPLKEFVDTYKQVHETGVVDLTVDEIVYPVLIKHVQRDMLRDAYLHADFYKVNLKQKIKATVPVITVGDAPAVADKVGILQQTVSDIEVEALPDRLPDQLEVNIEHLAAVDQHVTVADIVLPEGATILTEPTTVVVKISPLAAEEPVEAPVEETVEGATEAEAAETETETSEEAPNETPEE